MTAVSSLSSIAVFNKRVGVGPTEGRNLQTSQYIQFVPAGVLVANFHSNISGENSSRRSDVPVSNNLFVDSQASRLDEEVCIHPLYNKDKLMNMKNLQKKFSKAEFYSSREETANRFHNSHHILPSISLLIFCRQFTVSFCTYR